MNLLSEKEKDFTRDDGRKWHEDNPVKMENIVHHYNQSTDDEKRQGMDWYKDAHHASKALAEAYNVPHHTMAGLIANYSPQTDWARNLHTAAHVARTKIPLGGPGSGVMAREYQKEDAGKILKGEHYDNVLKGNKIRAFAHLIEHGGNKDSANPRVCIDRHAMSVAAGKRMPDSAFEHAKLKTNKKYNEVSKAYTDAARHIKDTTGTHIEPHQLQAVTWLTRQRLNDEESRALSKNMKHAAGSRANVAQRKWAQYIDEHHPHLAGTMPGTGYHKEDEDYELEDNIIESKLNNLSPRELHQKLKDAGWKETDKSGGSHTLYTHPKFQNKVAVPRHTGFIRTGTLRSILKDAGIRENALNKAKYIMKEAKENEKQKKIVIGQNKTKVKIHPTLKEMVENKVFTSKDLMKAVYFPEGIIGDPNASSELKDYAFQILRLRTEI